VTLSPFVIVSVLLQIVLLTFFEFAMPKAQPEKIQRVLVYLSTVGAVAVTGGLDPVWWTHGQAACAV
jgi:formate hydrogenlyase subunit 4